MFVSGVTSADSAVAGLGTDETLADFVPNLSGVVIFGDSWAEDSSKVDTGLFAGVSGWPVHLARKLRLPIVGNFAVGQSESRSLTHQLRTAVHQLGRQATWSEYLVILHCGGNDFIGAERGYNPLKKDNFWLAHCTYGFKKKAEEVMQNLRTFLDALHAHGCRNFLVSELPFTTAVPVLNVARLAFVNRRGRWLAERLAGMLQDFEEAYNDNSNDSGPGSVVRAVQVPEVSVLRCCVKSTSRRSRSELFLRDMFHPTDDFHRLLAGQYLPYVFPVA
mmetsp:Transcript_23392/g.59789  ORF Transcript_23392/g.59789 Transcript_23392/m.59789 type:complete len:276 (-) Transcript_23392:394-1221(-)